MGESARVLGKVATRMLFENDRVRIWEMDLPPGGRSDVHRHDLDYVLVILEGDRIAAEPEPDTAGAFREPIEFPVEPGTDDLRQPRRHRDGDQRRAQAIPRDPHRAQVVGCQPTK